MTREEIVAKIKELEARIAASDKGLDPTQSYSEHLAQSSEWLRELARLQTELKAKENKS